MNLACVVIEQHDAIISTDGWCGSRNQADHYESVHIIEKIANAARREL